VDAVTLPVERLGYHGQPLRFVGLNNLIHVDVPPITARLIHDLHLRVLAEKLAHIPTGRHQTIASPAGRTFDGFAINKKVQTGIMLIVAAADAK
jgi:hypothetical protein